MKLLGKTAIITGASAGLGYVTARTFIAEGASVFICGRRAGNLDRAYAALADLASHQQKVGMYCCDVACETDVRDLVRRAIDLTGSVQILVNNAGILGPIGLTEGVPLEDWRRTFETNFYGVLFACREMIPHMRSMGYGKILNLSGGGAASPRPFFSAYATSKAAVVRLTENLAEELRATKIDVNAVAPGALNTDMLEQTLAAGEALTGEPEFTKAAQQKVSGGSSIDKAAALCVYLASSASDGISGRLISAPWDPWPTLHEHAEQINGSDVYTLRRIVPEDRWQPRADS